MIALLLTLFTLSSAGDPHGGDWTYDNISAWVIDFPECAGQFQSPIDIPWPATGNVTNPVPIVLTYPNVSTVSIIVTANRTIGISKDANGAPEGLTTNGTLISPGHQWVFETAHFHWGPSTIAGSEHAFNGSPFPLELHMIHYNPRYANFTEAFDKVDGLLVLGIMFALDNTTNHTALEELNLELLSSNGTATYGGISLSWKDFLPADAATNYATYPGSLTTPPCHYSVRWVVMHTPQKVSEYQLELLRKISPYNNRPRQDLRGRTILFSSTDVYTEPPTDSRGYSAASRLAPLGLGFLLAMQL